MQKKPTVAAVPLTPAQNTTAILRKIFTDYLDTTGAILSSHLFVEDASLELKEADKNLLSEIDDLEIETADFDSLIEQLEKLKNNNDDSFDEDKLLELCSEDAILDAADIPGYIVIKLQSITDTDKLVEFVNREIYPYNLNNGSALKV